VLREWLDVSLDRRLEIVSPIAQEVSPFLLHLSPQVVVTKSGAADYLDSQVDIVRSPREKLDKRLVSGLRSLGKGRAAVGVAGWSLVTAIAARGMKTSFKDLAAVGWRPIALMVLETAWIAAITVIAVMFAY
jgi:hypothetical protein